MDLAELRFKVDTTELEKADKAIGQLAASVGKLNKASDDAAKMAAKQEAADAKRAKELAKVAVESEKVNQAKAKTAKVEAEAAAASEKAAAATAKSALASTKAEAASLRIAKAKEAEAAATREAVSIQQRQTDILEFMQQGYTRGQSSVLAYAKAAGEATGEIAKILDLQRQLIGGDPFDKSLSGVKALKNEISILTEVQNLYNQGANLTTKQVRELARDEERLLQVMKQRGASDTEIQQATENLKREYLGLAGQVNTVVEQERKMIQTRKEAAAGAKYVADTDARLAAALEQTNQSLDRRATDTLVKYKAALVATGASSDQVAAKMNTLKNQLDAVASKERAQQLQYLARAISVQMGDVAISLASGMNPLLVMIQQGDQIRGAIEQTGAKGRELTEAMTQGAKNIAVGFVNTAYAIGTFFTGAITSAGSAVVEFLIAPTKLAYAAWTDLANGTNTYAVAVERAKAATLAFAKIGVVALVVVLATLAVEYYKIMKAETDLSRSLALTGASMNLTKNEAVDYARAMSEVAGSTMKAMDIISQMAKTGNLGKESIEMITESAVNLQKYGGVAIEDTVKQFSEMSKDPVKGLIELAKATGNVELATIKQVKVLVDQKKYAEAAALAIQATAESNRKTANQMKSDLSPLERLWIDIKELIDQAREAIYEFATSSQVVGVLRKVWEVFAVILAEVFYVVKSIGKELGGIAAQFVQFLSGNFAAAGQIRQEMKADAEAARKEQDLLIDRILGRGKAEEDSSKKSIEAMRKEAAERKKNSDAAAAYERTLKEKKEKEPKTASGTFPAPRNNELAELEKRFNSELQLTKQFAEDKRAVLKSQFDAGLIERGEFIAKDTQLLNESERNQLALVASYENKFKEAYTNIYIGLVEARDKALAGTKGLKDAEKAQQEILKGFADQVQRLEERAGTAAARFDDLKQSIGSAITTREIQRINDFAKATFENQKAYIAFNNAIKDVNTQRQLELELQDSLVGVSEAAAAGIRAEFEEMKRLAPEIRKFNDEVIRAKKELDAVRATGAEEDDPVLKAAVLRYQEAMTIADAAIANARQQQQNAATDAIAAYYQKEMIRIQNSVTDAIVTALFEGGKAGSKKIRDLIVAELKKPVTMIVQAVVNPIVGSVLGAFGFGPSSSASSGSSGMSLGNIANAASAGKTLMDVVTLGYTGAITSQMNKLIFSDVGQMLKLSAPNYLNVAAPSAGTGGVGGLNVNAGSTGGLNAGASSTGGITASTPGTGTAGAATMTELGKTVQNVGVSLVTGYIANKIRAGIAGGYQLSGAGETILDVANIVAGFGDPITQLIVGAISGLVSRAFGRKLTESGVMGTFGGDAGFAGSQYTFEKGGWFRSDKTRTSALDPELEQGLADQFNTVRASVLMLAGGLGIGSDAILNFTKDIKVNLKGLSEEDALAALEKVFLDVQEELAGVALGTDEYSRANETNLDTLNRLHDALTTVNATFDNLGFQLYDLSLANADAAQSFIDLFGGMDKFKEVTGKYYDTFYTEEEKTANLTRQLTTAFGALGVELPTTREGFRALADAAKAAGNDQLFAGMLLLQDAFLALVPATEKTVAALLAEAIARERTNQEIAEGLLALQKEAANLNIEWLQVTGRTKEANTAIRALAIEGMTAAEIAAYDSNEALRQLIATRRAEISAMDAIASRLSNFASEAANLSIEILRLAGKSQEADSAFRALSTQGMTDVEVAAWDYNQSLKNQIASINQAKTAHQEAAAAVQNLNNTIDSLRSQATSNYLSALSRVEAARQRVTELEAQAAEEREQQAAQAAYDAQMQRAEAYKEAQSQIKSLQDQATSNYLSAQERLVAAQERAEEVARQLARSFLEISNELVDYVNSVIRTPGENFGQLLAKAIAGDAEAMRQLPSAATQATEEAKSVASSLIDFKRQQAKILIGVLDAAKIAKDLAGDTTQEDLASEAVQVQRELRNAQVAANEALRIANAINAPLTKSNQDIIAEYRRLSAVQAVQIPTALEKVSESASEMEKAMLELQSAEAELADALRVANAIGAPLYEQQQDLIAEYTQATNELAIANNALAEANANLQQLLNNPPQRPIELAINDAFMEILGRPVDNAGLAYFEQMYASGQGSILNIERDILTGATGTDTAAAEAYIAAKVSDAFLRVLGRTVDEAGLAWWTNFYRSTGNLSNLDLDIARAAVGTDTAAASAFLTNVPAFADGGRYSGGLALVGERGPELINFNRSGEVFSAGRTASVMGSMNTDLVTELQYLREEVSLLRSEVRADVQHNAKTARLLDRVIPNGDSIQVEIAA